VHPDEETAHRQGHEHGKTEMWYVVNPTPGAALYCGLKQQITPEQYKEMVADDTITDALARYEVSDGDVFFIPAGRIHAIGAGCFVAEIQQTSDVTYRIYDYKRRDKDGNLRQLHTKEAAESIDYSVLNDYRQHYDARQNEGQQLISCPYFTTAVYDLTEPMTIDYSELDSFVALIGLKGVGLLSIDGDEVVLHAGETILLPAFVKEVNISGTVKFLETYVLS
jgi:mannose-6-phosphate isomerase